MYDLIIVGAGPAGAILARLLGIQVRLHFVPLTDYTDYYEDYTDFYQRLGW